MTFDYDVKITSFVGGNHLEIILEGKPVYAGDFPYYTAAAAFADHFLNDEYRKRVSDEYRKRVSNNV